MAEHGTVLRKGPHGKELPKHKTDTVKTKESWPDPMPRTYLKGRPWRSSG